MPSHVVAKVPALATYVKSLKGRSLELSTEGLVRLLRLRHISGSEPCAIATATLLLHVVQKSQWHDVDGLLEIVRATGRRLVNAQPKELVVANMVRRVLSLIRDEALEERNELSSETQSEALMTPTDPAMPHNWPLVTHVRQNLDSGHTSSSLASISTANGAAAAAQAPSRMPLISSHSTSKVPRSLLHLLSTDGIATPSSTPMRSSGTSTPAHRQVDALRFEVVHGIEEIMDEISQVDDQIATSAEVHICPDDWVLVNRPSSTMERVLLRAASKRRFTVLIVTGTPASRADDQQKAQLAALSKRLSMAGVSTIVMGTTAPTSYMSRVNKVMIGARAVLANGSAVTDPGASVIARAAREKGCSVVVLAGVYMLSPELLLDEASFMEGGDPSAVVSFDNGPLVQGVEVRTATTDLVPDDLIDVYITNMGTCSRDHLSNLIADHYKSEDVDFHLECTTDQ